MREFVEKEIKPYAEEWEELGKVPIENIKKIYQAGFIPGILGVP